MAFIFAFIPIALILILMVGSRWGPAIRAPYWSRSSHFGAGPELLAYAQAKALLLTLDGLFIIWAAFLLYRLAEEAADADRQPAGL